MTDHHPNQNKLPDEPKTDTDLQQLEARIEPLKAEIAQPKTQVPVQHVKSLPNPEEQQRLLSVRDKCRAMAAADKKVPTEGLNNSLDYMQWKLEVKLDQEAEDILADLQDDPNARAAERGRAAYLVAKTERAPTPATEAHNHAEQIAARVAKKFANPAGNPSMSIKETAHALSKSVRTIRRYLDDEKLAVSGIPGRVTTESVKRLASQSPKDGYQLAQDRRDSALSKLKRIAKTLTPREYAERKRAIEIVYDKECQCLDHEANRD